MNEFNGRVCACQIAFGSNWTAFGIGSAFAFGRPFRFGPTTCDIEDGQEATSVLLIATCNIEAVGLAVESHE